VPDLDLLRQLAPPVEPASPDALRQTRERVAGRARRRRRTFRRRLVVAIPLALAAVLALAVVGTRLDGTRLDRGDQPAWAAEAVRAAEASPRLLLPADGGWVVTRVDEWSAGTGEMSFEAGTEHIDLRWAPATDEIAVAVKKGPGDRLFSATVQGARATIVAWSGGFGYRASWREGDTDVVVQGEAASPEAFIALLGELQRVSVDEWLSALPAAAVTPAEHDVAVGEMLDGMPLPPGVQAADLEAETSATRDRYQLGAKVVSVVACGWIAQWAEARASGDAAARKAAEEAMAGSRTWPILLEMNAEGDYPEVVWEFAAAMAGGGERKLGEREKGKVVMLGVEDTYEQALGCGQ